RRLAKDGSEDGLRAAAALADDDPWRQRLRDRSVRKDGKLLGRLAREDSAPRQPTANLLILSAALQETGGKAEAERLLRSAQKLPPNDFWLNVELANLLTQVPDGEAAEAAEAVSFWRAALALRPKSAEVYNGLGLAWWIQKRFAEAAEAFRQAV